VYEKKLHLDAFDAITAQITRSIALAAALACREQDAGGPAQRLLDAALERYADIYRRSSYQSLPLGQLLSSALHTEARLAYEHQAHALRLEQAGHSASAHALRRTGLQHHKRFDGLADSARRAHNLNVLTRRPYIMPYRGVYMNPMSQELVDQLYFARNYYVSWRGGLVALIKEDQIDELRRVASQVVIVYLDAEALSDEMMRAQMGAVTDYHYHVYDFHGSAPWTACNPLQGRSQMRFFSIVQDLNALVAEGTALNVPNLQRLNLGWPINADASSFRSYALRFGRNTPGTPKIVIAGGIHAREWIAAEMAYLTADYLIKNYSSAPVGKYQTQLSQLIESRDIYILPMLNPAGNDYSVRSPDGDAQLWSKNRRDLASTPQQWVTDLDHPPFSNVGANGTDVHYDVPELNAASRTVNIDSNAAMWGVDCNGNCNTPKWGHETKNGHGVVQHQGNPTDDSYFGPRRASEQEILNLQTLCQGRVAASIDFHSYGQLIILPTESTVSEQQKRLGQALRLLIERNDSEPYTLGTPLTTVGYHVVSSIADYLACARGSRAFTVEVDPIKDPTQDSKFQLPDTQIKQIFEKNIRGVLSLMATAGGNPRSFWCGMCGCCCASPWASTVAKFEAWDVAYRGNDLPDPSN
jgi:hypothetical protein